MSKTGIITLVIVLVIAGSAISVYTLLHPSPGKTVTAFLNAMTKENYPLAAAGIRINPSNRETFSAEGLKRLNTPRIVSFRILEVSGYVLKEISAGTFEIGGNKIEGGEEYYVVDAMVTCQNGTTHRYRFRGTKQSGCKFFDIEVDGEDITDRHQDRNK